MAYIIKEVEPTAIPALAEVEKKIGTSHSLRLMAHRPDAMRHFIALYETLMGPRALLNSRLRESVYLAVSTVNEAAYCTAHHTRDAMAAGLTHAEAHRVENENDEQLLPRERAAVEYARELTREASVGDDTRYRVQEHFTDDEFVELTLIVGLANFTNRFNNGLGVPLER